MVGGEDSMPTIKKVLNSSVILLEDQGKEKIALGKGIGFGRKAGEIISMDDVDQVYLPVEDQKTTQVLEMLGDIPFEFFDVTQRIVKNAEKSLNKKLNASIYLTLTDHLNFAVERAQEGVAIANRLYWEIKNYYPNEFEIGKKAVDVINHEFEITLPKEEASNIAFHLINAQSENTQVTDGFKYAKMIGGIVNMVRYSIQKEINTDSIHYTRFITHVRFFVERFYQDHLLKEENAELAEQMWIIYPTAMAIATKVKEYIEKIYKCSIPEDEVVYLAVHINRLMKYTRQ